MLIKSGEKEGHTYQGIFRGDSKFRTLVLAGLILFVTVAVYSPVHGYDFFDLDDHFYILDNVHIQDSLNWPTIRWCFTSFDHANWIPLSFLSLSLDYQLFGRDPSGYHDINVLFHALNAALLFWVLKRATGYTGRSFVVGLLFALHPLNVEGVAWIAERKTVLSMFFFLLALGAYRWYAAEPRLKRLSLVLVFFAMGLLAKAQIITFPFVLLLWDYWPLKRMFPSGTEPGPYPKVTFADLITEKLPLFAICLLDGYFTLLAEGFARPRWWPPLSQRLANAIFSYARYLKLTFWPSGMTPMYPNPGASLTRLQVWGSLAILIAISLLVLWARRRRYPLVCWLWFLGTLTPTIQIIQFGKEGMADRFAYQALIGLFILICWGFADFAAQEKLPVKWLAASSAAALLALTLVTHRQISYWKTPTTMWRHALEIFPNHWMAEDQLGLELAHAGRRDEALPYFQKVVAFAHDDSVGNIQIAIYDQSHGNVADAIAHYKAALRDPTIPNSQMKGVLRNISVDYRQLGDYAKANEFAAKAASVPND